MKRVKEGMVLDGSGISRFKYNESEVYLDCDGGKNKEELHLYDLMINNNRDGEPKKFDEVISQLVKKFGGVKKVYYYALHEFEVRMYQKLGFEVQAKDDDEEFLTKCVMVKEV